MAKDWWNPFGSCKPLHEINPLRVGFIEKYCLLEGLSVLDVGCGGGILTESLARAKAKVVGIDLCPDAINIARQHAQQGDLSIHYDMASAESYASDHPAEFDVVTCMELLEHVPEPASLIEACSKLLKPSGHLFLSTINRNLKAYLLAIIGAEYLFKMLPAGTHHYERFIKPSELFDMLQAADLQLANMAGIHYHPISKTYQLKTDVSVNYLAHCYKDVS